MSNNTINHANSTKSFQKIIYYLSIIDLLHFFTEKNKHMVSLEIQFSELSTSRKLMYNMFILDITLYENNLN